MAYKLPDDYSIGSQKSQLRWVWKKKSKFMAWPRKTMPWWCVIIYLFSLELLKVILFFI
jgi:hypothetical protein